jgi:hypothetical protein
MEFSKYNYFYVNGCSYSEGGGLEEESIKKESVVPIYKKIYGVTWKNREEVNFGKRLEEIIGIKCINESKSGGGSDRVVRTTYDFIFKNWKDKDKFFIILEKPDSSRSDVFYKKTNQYYIVNSSYKNNNDKNRILEFENSTREYFNQKYLSDKEDQNVFKNWFDNHYDFEQKFLQDEKSFIGLYSFCKQNSIKIFLMESNEYLFKDCFDSSDIIQFSKMGYNGNCNINDWCYFNNLSILHELNGHSDDGHPGYFGHIEYAKQLALFLDFKGKIDIFGNRSKSLI